MAVRLTLLWRHGGDLNAWKEAGKMLEEAPDVGRAAEDETCRQRD